MVLLAILSACRKNAGEKENAPFAFYEVDKFDLCLQNLNICMVLNSVNNFEDLLEDIKFVKLLPNSEVYKDIDFRNIRIPDRNKIVGAGFFTALKTIRNARKIALESGFKIPTILHIDANCSLPYSQNNAYFRPEYGYESKDKNKPTLLKNVICLGKLFSAEGNFSLAADKFVVSHEYFHSIFANAFLGENSTLLSSSLTMSHDLDSFNEGAADFFAELSTQSFLNSIFSALFPWRTKYAATQEKSGLYGNIYRDGMKYKHLLTQLSNKIDGLKLLSCSVHEMSQNMQNSKDVIDKLDEKDNLRQSNGQLDRVHLENWGFNFKATDILKSIQKCIPAENLQFAKIQINQIFPEILEENLSKKADVFAIVVPSLNAMCGIQKAYHLNPQQFRNGLYIDPCQGTIENTDSSSSLLESLNMAKTEIDSYSMEQRLFQSVYVITAIRIPEGEAADCRMQSMTLLSGGEVSFTTNSDDPASPYKAYFNMKAFTNDGRRGSWYRDIPVGDFLARESQEKYRLQGPFAEISASGFHVVSYETENGYPSNGLNGYFWTLVQDLQVDTKIEKYKKISNWVKKTLAPYQLDSQNYKPCNGENSCDTVQNIELNCRSHMSPTDSNQPENIQVKKIEFSKIEVGIFDCSEPGGASCTLQNY